MKLIHFGVVAGLAVVLTQTVMAIDLDCGPLKLQGGFGPFDYRSSSERRDHLPIVERFHFDREIQAVDNRKRSLGSIGDNLSYTLIAFPNHYPALQSLMNLSDRVKEPKMSTMRYPFECYFERAVRFVPDDPQSHMFYAMFLQKKDRTDEALSQLLEAEKATPEDANVQYNLGLMYLRKKDYERATEYAKKAYEQKFPLSGLRDKLKQAGHPLP